MKKYLFIMLSALVFYSCKKDKAVLDQTPAPVTASDYFKLDIGNYWVYKVDQFNHTRIDSFIAARDTVIRGNVYTVIEGHDFVCNWVINNILRDSSNYMVNYQGQIQFALDNFIDELEYIVHLNGTDTMVTLRYKMVNDSSQIIVQAGTFNTIRTYQAEVNVFNQDPNIPNPKFDKYYYNKGVGLVKSINNFTTGTAKIEKRLLRYSVK